MINKVEICGVNTTKLPILSNEEKKELLLKIKNGDKDAREKFINGNLRLVLSVDFQEEQKVLMIYSKLDVSD